MNHPWDKFYVEVGEAHELTLVGPRHHEPHYLESPTIYIDGGARLQRCYASSQVSKFPMITVGDGDSLGDDNKLDLRLDRDKDFSDLAFALRHIPDSIQSVIMLGFLGGRRDHELANLGEVHAFAKRRSTPTEIKFFEYGQCKIRVILCGQSQIEIHGLFSIFVLEKARFSLRGQCRFQVPEPRSLEPMSSLGLSNEGFGQILVNCDQPFFVLSNQENP